MKEPPKPKKKPALKLSQKEKFIEYAREVKADESGEAFDRAINDLIKVTPKNGEQQ